MSGRPSDRAGGSHTTLQKLLSRFHFGITLFAVALSGMTILLAGITTLRSYADRNIELAAKLGAYGAEPALVFNDRQAAQEGLEPLMHIPGIARLRLLDDHDRPIPLQARPLNAAGDEDGVGDQGCEFACQHREALALLVGERVEVAQQRRRSGQPADKRRLYDCTPECCCLGGKAFHIDRLHASRRGARGTQRAAPGSRSSRDEDHYAPAAHGLCESRTRGVIDR